MPTLATRFLGYRLAVLCAPWDGMYTVGLPIGYYVATGKCVIVRGATPAEAMTNAMQALAEWRGVQVR